MTGFQVHQPNSQLSMSRTYQYYADSQLQFSHNALDERFDRAYAYDHAARASEAYSGSEARDFTNGTNSGAPTGPYRQSYQYNSFNQTTQQTNRLWSDNETTTSTFVNNRKQGWGYDAAGLVTRDDSGTYTRDAAGQVVQTVGGDSHSWNKFAGDGSLLSTTLTTPGFHTMRTIVTYYLNSTVMGGLAVAELTATGQKKRGYVYAGGRKIAEATSATVTLALPRKPVRAKGKELRATRRANRK